VLATPTSRGQRIDQSQIADRAFTLQQLVQVSANIPGAK
jgi:hypothetical protein